jgi:hypothetical protein
MTRFANAESNMATCSRLRVRIPTLDQVVARHVTHSASGDNSSWTDRAAARLKG